MLRSFGFYVVTMGFAVGVFARSFFDFGVAGSVFVVLLSGGVFFVWLLFRRESEIVLLVALVLFSFGLGVVRFAVADRVAGSVVFDERIGQEVVLEGTVVREPELRESGQRLVVETHNTRILVTTNQHPAFFYGDKVVVRGELVLPRSFETDTGTIFNYPAYLAKDNIYYQMFRPEIEWVSSGGGNVVVRSLLSLKHAFIGAVSKSIPEPHAALAGGITVGAQESLGRELLDDFRRTGIIHIVVLSGYNVSIVAESIMRAFSFLPRMIGMSLGGVGVVLFAILTGLSATTMRASIMALLIVLARSTGRTYGIVRALFLAGFVMLLHNPKILVFDPSFQLSFLATLGLIVLAPLIEKRLGWIPTRWKLREVATATIATQLFVLPLLLFQTGELSIVALVVNLLVLAIIPAAMLTTFLTGTLGLVSTILSTPFAYATFGLLAYVLGVVDVFAKLPFASITIPHVGVWGIVVMYALYGVVVWRMRKH